MGVLWIKKILFNLFAWTVFLFLWVIILLYVLYWTSKPLHDSLVNTLPLPTVIKSLDISLTQWNDGPHWSLWNLSINNIEWFSTIIDLYSETKHIRNCKVIEDFTKNDDLGLVQLACGIWNSTEYKTIKLMSLHFPKTTECGYYDSRDYLQNLLTRKIWRLQLYGQKNWVEYWYFYMWDLNINNDILKKWFAFYIEHWMKDKKLIDSIRKSERGLEGLYKKCSVENENSIEWKQILTPN